MQRQESYYHTEEMNPAFSKIHLNMDGQLPIPFHPVYHHLTGPDTGDPHDHPFDIKVFVRRGWYVERKFSITRFGRLNEVNIVRRENEVFTIPAGRVHSIVEVSPGGCWTDCEYGEKVQEPSFYRFKDGEVFKRTWNSSEWVKVKI